MCHEKCPGCGAEPVEFLQKTFDCPLYGCPHVRKPELTKLHEQESCPHDSWKSGRDVGGRMSDSL